MPRTVQLAENRCKCPALRRSTSLSPPYPVNLQGLPYSDLRLPRLPLIRTGKTMTLRFKIQNPLASPPWWLCSAASTPPNSGPSIATHGSPSWCGRMILGVSLVSFASLGSCWTGSGKRPQARQRLASSSTPPCSPRTSHRSGSSSSSSCHPMVLRQVECHRCRKKHSTQPYIHQQQPHQFSITKSSLHHKSHHLSHKRRLASLSMGEEIAGVA